MGVVASELEARFSADLTDLEAGFKKAESLQRTFISSSAAIKANPLGNLNEVATSFKQLDVSVKSTGEVLSKYKFESQEAATAAQKLKQVQLESAQATLANKNQIMALRAEKQQLTNATNAAKLKMQELAQSQTQVKGSSDNLLKSITSLKGIMAGGSFLAVGGFGKEAIDAFSGFEGKLKEIQAVSSVTSDQMKQLSDRALELGEKFPASARDAAGGFAELSKAGFTTNEVLQSSLGLVTLSTAGNLEMGRSAEILAGSIRGFGLAATDANHVVDLLAQTANQSSVDLTDMGESFKYIAPAAQAAGFNIEDMSVALGLMGNSMIKGSEAGTSLRSIITGLTAPTAEGANALKGLGVSVEGAGGKVKPFREIITELRGSFTTLSQTDQIDMAKKIVGKEAMSGFLSVIRATDEDFRTMTDSIDHADGAAKKMADTMSSGLQGKMNNLSGSVESLQIKMGEKLAPGFGKLVDAFNSAIPKITDLTLNIGTFLSEAFKNAADAIGPVASSLEFIGSVADRVNLKVRELGAGTITTNKSVADNLNFGNAFEKQSAKAFEGIDLFKTKIQHDLFESQNAIDRFNQGIFKSGEDAAPKLISLQKNFQYLKDTASSLKDAGVDAELAKLGQSLDQLRDKVGPINGVLAPAIENLGKVSLTNADSIQTRLPPAMTVVAQKADDTGKRLSFLTDEMKRLGEAAATSSAEMNDASGKMKVLDDIALKSSPAVQELWKEYKMYSEKAAEGGSAQDKWNTKAEAARDKMATLVPKMGDVAKAYEIQKNKLDNATKSFEDNTISLSLNEGSYNDVQAASEKAAASISKTGDATADAAKMAKSHVADWKDAGFQSVQGFIDAISAGAGRAAAAAAGVASQAASATRQKLSIQSPSKVFEEIGQFMMKGWQLGIDKNGEPVIGAVAKTFSDVMGAVKTGVDAINSVSTFEGMNNAAANQFIFDSGNFITVFGEKGKAYSAKFLEATSAYADGLSKGLGTIKGGVEGLNALATYGGMSNAVMNQFVQDEDNFLIVFSQKAKNHSIESLKSAEVYAQSFGTIVATVGPGVEGLNALGTYVGYAQVNLNKFMDDSDNLMLGFTARAGKFAPKVIEGTNLYAESFGLVTAKIAPGVDGMNALAEYAGVVRTNLVLFADDAEYAVTTFSAKAAAANPDLIKATATWAEGTGKIVSVIGSSVTALKSVSESEYKRVSATMVLAIVEDVKLTADYMGMAAVTMSEDVLKKTNAYADMAGKVTTTLKASVEFFKTIGTEDYSGLWLSLGGIIQGVEDTVNLLGVAAGKSDKDTLTLVTNYSTNLGKVFTPFKGIVENLKAIAGLKFNPEENFKPLMDGIDQSLIILASFLSKTVDYADLAGKASLNMLEGGKALGASASQLGPGGVAAPALPAPIPLGSAFGGERPGVSSGSGMTINFQPGSIVISGDSKETEADIRKIVQQIFREEGEAYIARQQAAGVRF